MWRHAGGRAQNARREAARGRWRLEDANFGSRVSIYSKIARVLGLGEVFGAFDRDPTDLIERGGVGRPRWAVESGLG